jgi:hypothetical protein
MEQAMRRLAAQCALGLLALAGCAAPEPSSPPTRSAASGVPEPRPDWATELPELLPAIRACLDASGQPPVGVTKAWPIAGSLAGVRMLSPSGERLDCVAETAGGDVLLTEKVWTISQLPGEREPLFTPRSQAEPSSSPCLSVSVARDAGGDDVGWLSYDVCRQPRAAGPSAEADTPKRYPMSGGNS